MIQNDRSFRLVCDPNLIPLAEDLLAAQGFVFEADPLLPAARLLKSGPLPLGASFAARFGLLYIQDRSSMLPPLALAPAPGSAALDMCASPGSKTGMLGLMTGDTGFVLANEPSAKRLGTLRRNLQAQNLFCCATTSFAGESLPLPSALAPLPEESGPVYPGWQYILLDPPCSGWGTADKHPQVARLWQGDKIAPLAALQGRLLAEAARLLAPGGLLAYSTCTTNVLENEDQVLRACREYGLELLPLEPPPGFPLSAPQRPGCDGVWRVERGPHGQGFFVALLRKADAASPEAPLEAAVQSAAPPLKARTAPGANDAHTAPGTADANPGFFVRPWEAESRFVGERRRHGGKAGRHGAARGSGEGGAAFLALDRAALAGPCLDPDLLPPGEVAVFNSVAHFLPRARGRLLPPGFVWKGFPLGRLGKNGELRPFSHLRRLMPASAPADALVLEDAEPLRALVSGQSLRVGAGGPEVGLYYKELPLCRLAVKNGRALLPQEP